MEYTLSPLGDASIVIQLGEEIDQNIQEIVNVIASNLDRHPFPGMIEYIPAYTTLTIFYNPVKIQNSRDNQEISQTLPYQLARGWIDQLIAELPETEEEKSRVINIPVCYGTDYGPDLGFVAEHNGLTKEDVIDIHSSRDYLVYMIGFAPGHPYMGGMSDKIATPRRDSPRMKIPARSVGVAGMQTGIYPIETPGGWQLIGKTPIQLFRPNDEPPSLLKPGDTIRFYPISKDEFRNWEGGHHEYQNS